jgi:hypothetical protein
MARTKKESQVKTPTESQVKTQELSPPAMEVDDEVTEQPVAEEGVVFTARNPTKKRISVAVRSGLTFPPSRIRRYMRIAKYANHIQKGKHHFSIKENGGKVT